jgi:two-component system cell cycle sensor histidine kinase/response regulator CckA
MTESYLLVISLIHLAFAAVFFFLNAQTPSRLVRYYGWVWVIEAARALILLPPVYTLGDQRFWWVTIDMLLLVSTWLSFSGAASVVTARLPRRLGHWYIGVSAVFLVLNRFAGTWFVAEFVGLSQLDAALLTGAIGMWFMFVPASLARLVAMYWFFSFWQRTRLPGGLAPVILFFPSAVGALTAPYNFTFNYYPPWVYLFWVFQVLSLSIGLLILVVSQHHAAELRAEEERRESEERYRTLFENAPIGIYQTTPAGSISVANPALVKMLGFSSFEELAGRNLETEGAFEPSYSRESFKERIERDGAIKGLECVWRRKDGSRLFVRENAQVVRDGRGQVVSYQGTVEDISDQVQAGQVQKSLAGERDRLLRQLQLILDHMPIACILTDLEFRVTYWNPAAERIFGYRIGEALGQNAYGLVVPPAVRAKVRAAHDRVRREAADSHEEEENVTKEGKVIYCEWHNTPLRDPQGRVAGMLSMAQEVTERKRAEEVLRRTQEQLLQARKMEAIGRLAGGIAHDFNNLLTTILGYASFLSSEYPADSPSGLPVSEIEKAGRRAADLTRQLLAFSRKQVLQLQVLNLNQEITDSVGILRRLMGEDVDIQTALAPSLHNVKADRGQIHQVLLNLAANARDAMPEGGTFTIKTENQLIARSPALQPSLRPGVYASIKVSDSGCGMTPEVRDCIFEPFFTTKETGKGTGLGLATVYGIVTQTGGSISVESELGKGSVFTIYLPSVLETETGLEVERPMSQSAGGRETVLVVEDSEAVRKLVCRVLERQGYRVIEAADAENALREAGACPDRIDLLLTDLVMPRMNGRELAQRLMDARPDLRVLFVSGYADIPFSAESGAPHADFLQKPFSAGHVARKVREILDRRGLESDDTAIQPS